MRLRTAPRFRVRATLVRAGRVIARAAGRAGGDGRRTLRFGRVRRGAVTLEARAVADDGSRSSLARHRLRLR